MPTENDIDRPDTFYLGAEIDPATGERSEDGVHLESSDLTTHGVIVGMTGSGKTGLGVDLLEEALLDGIPCLVIDPKGDMGNLALVFPELSPGAVAQEADIPTPEAFFGFRMGAEGELAHWDELVEYYRLLDERSRRIRVEEMGPSTLGAPFLVAFVSAPDNLARLEELKRLNATLTDPRGASEAAIERAIDEGRAVVVQSYGLHSTEVAGAQTPAELLYDMATRDDEEMRRILEETVGIVLPSLNPDGTEMVADWVDETAATEYEGAYLPWLYHHYIGHDNNRDAFQQNTIESVYGGRILFREWVPQAYIDHHQMGSYGPRLYLPPYAEPIRPDADPLVWREMSWWGSHIAYREEEQGRSGVTGASIYSGWGHFGFHWITPFHNIAGMLTESASARMAWPLYVHPDQLEGRPGRGLPEYEEQVTFPNPWPGGWWTVRDIVEQQVIASLAALDVAARNRRTVLRNHYLKAKRQTERGRRAEPATKGPEGPLAAFVLPAEQHDPLTRDKLVEKLLLQGIEVRRAEEDFVHEGRVYGAGSHVVTLAQPKRGVIRWLLGRTFYPDNSYTRYRDGSPIPPYDMSTDNMAEFMGVEAVPVHTHVTAPLREVVPDFEVAVEERLPRVVSGVEREGEVEAGGAGYVVDGRLNDAFRVANQLLDEGVAVRRATRSTGEGAVRPGDFLVGPDAPAAVLEEAARETGVDLAPLEVDAAGLGEPISRLRIGMYRRYYGGNMDEGWTRWLLERFGFPYERLEDDRIRAGDLAADFDVIVLPDDSPEIMKGPEDGEISGEYGRYLESFPPEYRSGFGDEGVEALEAFVRAGGTLLTFAEAGELAIEEFGLPVRNVVGGLPSTEFWSPGSTLRVSVDTDHPLGYGMPEEALAFFLRGNQAYAVVPHDRNETVDRVVTFVEAGEGTDQTDILRSGWLIGEEVISEKAAMVSVEHGEGRVVLIGFRPQHRAQTHGTFKLVFNALLNVPESAVPSPAERMR